jgi:hypothetical protein
LDFLSLAQSAGGIFQRELLLGISVLGEMTFVLRTEDKSPFCGLAVDKASLKKVGKFSLTGNLFRIFTRESEISKAIDKLKTNIRTISKLIVAHFSILDG